MMGRFCGWSIKTFAVFSLALTCTSTEAATTIYGFEFERPLALPECPLDTSITRVTGKKHYQVTPPITCRQDPRQVTGEPVPVVEINWSPKESPLVVKWWRAYAIELRGVLAGFHFLTNGAGSQSIVLDQLTEKFGPPTSVSRKQVQNLSAATFEAIVAVWRGGEVDVTFNGIGAKLDQGDVYIDSPEVTTMRREAVRALSGPKM